MNKVYIMHKSGLSQNIPWNGRGQWTAKMVGKSRIKLKALSRYGGPTGAGMFDTDTRFHREGRQV